MGLFNLEAVHHQPTSMLAQGMISSFQEVIDYRDKLLGDKNKIKKVVDFFNKTCLKNISNVIRKEVGLDNITWIVADRPNGMFAILPEIGKDNGFSVYLSLMESSGITEDAWLKDFVDPKTLTTAKDFEKAREKLDKINSRFKLDKINNKKIKIQIYMDPYTAFLSKETIHAKTNYLSADEIASILIHELGHFMSAIEYCADGVYKIKTLEKMANYFNENADVNEKIDLAIITAKNSGDEKIEKTVETLKELKKEQKNNNATNIIVKLIGLFLKILIIPLLSYVTLLFGVFGYKSGKIESSKGNDIFITNKNRSFWERKADEFAARHGLAVPLSTGLNKLYSMMIHYGYNKQFITSSIVYYINIINFGIGSIIMSGMTSYVYENTKQRVVSLGDDIIDMLKKQNLPEAIVDKYVQDYERILQSINDIPKSMKFADSMNTIMHYLNYWINPISIIDMVKNGRFTKEYNNLLYKIEKFQHNRLFYYSQKLKKLIK